MDIVEFLRARLDEDEGVAREAIEQRRQARMDHHQPDYDMQAWPDVSVPAVLVGPERVLREVEAKRAILSEIEAQDDFDPQMWGMARLPSRTLLALAATYADHPDHDPDWR